MANPNTALSDQHFTPPLIIEAARKVMGSIDIDPCTSFEVNSWSVKAPKFFTNNGLEELNFLAWDTSIQYNFRVWVNPPSKGCKGARSATKTWLEACHKHYQNGLFSEFFFMMFNREFLGLPILENVPVLHFEKRVKYWSWNNEEQCFKEGNYSAKGVWANAPDRPSSLLYFPPKNFRIWHEKKKLLNPAFEGMGKWTNLEFKDF